MKKLLYLSFIALTIIIIGYSIWYYTFKLDKLYLKYIRTPDIEIEWYFHSTITTITPDVITVKKGSELDTVCISRNIADVYLISDVIYIDFYGYPIGKSGSDSISIPDTILGYHIRYKTDKKKDSPVWRYSFKKN